MSVNYNWLSAGKRPTRGQVKLLRRDAHAVLAAPAAPALQFQESTCHDDCCDRRRLFCCWREWGYHRDAPPRGTLLTAWGQRSDTAGNFLTPSTTFVVRPPPRGATSRKQVFLKATYLCVGRNTGVVEVRRLRSSPFRHGSAFER